MKKILLVVLLAMLSGCGGETVENATEYASEAEEKEVVFYEKIKMEELSKAKNSWGMKRKPPEAPEFTKEQEKMMDKYGCIYLDPSEEKYIYLTFDEGYENGQTEKILDVLKEKGVTAAFFITGDYFKSEKAIVDRMVNEGHAVGNHTMYHPCVADIKSAEKIEKEILSLDLAFFERYGKHMKYFRFPEGAYSEMSLAVVQNLGYRSVFWSFAYDDWYVDKQRGKDFAYNKIIDNLHPGCVMLLHAVSKDNAEALGEVIDKAREMGYEFLALDGYIERK